MRLVEKLRDEADPGGKDEHAAPCSGVDVQRVQQALHELVPHISARQHTSTHTRVVLCIAVCVAVCMVGVQYR